MLHVVQTRATAEARTELDLGGRLEARVREWVGFVHLRCRGRPVFKTSTAVDVALALDLDHRVEEWTCLPDPVAGRDADGAARIGSPDFLVRLDEGSTYFLDVDEMDFRPDGPGIDYRTLRSSGLLPGRIAIANARGIMAHAETVVSLSDQVRLLSVLERAGSVPLIDAADAMRNAEDPIGAVLCLVAHRLASVAWRYDILCPSTPVTLGKASGRDPGAVEGPIDGVR